MQQAAVLLYHADLGTQAVLGDLGNILTIDQNFARLDIVKPQQQFQKRRFPRPRPAHQTYFFPRLNDQVKSVKPAPVAAIVVAQFTNLDLGLWHLQRFGLWRIHQSHRLGDGLHALRHLTECPKYPRYKVNDPVAHAIYPQHQQRRRHNRSDLNPIVQPPDHRPTNNRDHQQPIKKT